jgi:hypothetical protein
MVIRDFRDTAATYVPATAKTFEVHVRSVEDHLVNIDAPTIVKLDDQIRMEFLVVVKTGSLISTFR